MKRKDYKFNYDKGHYEKIPTKFYLLYDSVKDKIVHVLKFIFRKRYRRHVKYINYWNSQAERIAGLIKKQRMTGEDSVRVYFSWTQLMDQEIKMWNIIGEVDDFQGICDMRGFTEDQKTLLLEIIKVMGLKGV